MKNLDGQMGVQVELIHSWMDGLGVHDSARADVLGIRASLDIDLADVGADEADELKNFLKRKNFPGTNPFLVGNQDDEF